MRQLSVSFKAKHLHMTNLFAGIHYTPCDTAINDRCVATNTPRFAFAF